MKRLEDFYCCGSESKGEGRFGDSCEGCKLRKLILCLLLFVVQSAYAQSNYASLSGSVVDPQNSPVAGATVQLTAVDTPAARRATTNELGIFQITGLSPGDYRLVIKAPGFATLMETLRFEVGQQAALDMRLKLASVKSTVEVSGSHADVMHTTDASVGEVVEPESTTGQPVFGPGTHTAAKWFNPSAFTTPPAFTFGKVGRNSVYGPGMQTLDLALERTFRITEKSDFQFRGEFFNALNHTNLGTPNRFVNEPQFATITTAMTPGREVQLSARLSF